MWRSWRGPIWRPRGCLLPNRKKSGSSRRIARVLLMAEPADIDAGEIIDNGYINQRTTLERRQSQVDQLYADPPGDDVIVI